MITSPLLFFYRPAEMHSVNWLVSTKKKISWREFFILVLIVISVLNNAWMVPTIVQLNEKISKVHAQSKEELSNATARISKLEDQVRQLKENKASTEDIAVLSSSVSNLSELVNTKADRDFVTDLEDLRKLTASPLNQSYYDQLQGSRDMLELSKVSRHDFEILWSNFTSLADNTVRTSDFLELSAAVDDIDNTSVKKEEFFHLAVNVTTLHYYHRLVNITVSNATARISELEDEVRQLKGDLSTLEATCSTKASQNKVDHLSITVSTLNATKVENTEFEILSSTVSSLSQLVTTKADREVVVDLEENLRGLARTALNQSHYDQLQDGIDMLETSKASQEDFETLQSNFTSLAEENLNILAANALNHSHYDHLQNGIDQLETSKTSQEDFETLLSNFTSLADSTVRMSDFVKLSAAVDDIDSSTVKKEEFFRLAENVTILQYHHGLFNTTLSNAKASISELEDEIRGGLSTLEATKANQSDVNDLSVTVAMLNTTITEFVVLSSNVSNLRALVITKADRDVVVDLEENLNTLAANALNHSHYDQLQNGIDKLETSKTSQEDFETLLSNFTSLAGSTVRTSDFLQLSADVDDIDNSTVKKEEFFRLAENVTILQYHHGLFNTTLSNARARISELEDEIRGGLSTLEATKANQSDVNDLSVTVAMLNTTKVGITEFVVLSSNVSNLRALVITKADRDVVVDLEENLNILAANALNHSHYDQLQNGIDKLETSKTSQEDFETLLSNFTSLAGSTVRTSDFLQLSADVDDIDNSTVKNEEFFRLAKNVSNLTRLDAKVNSTPGLTASWMTLCAAVSLVIIYTCTST